MYRPHAYPQLALCASPVSGDRLIDQAPQLPSERVPVRRRELRERHDDHLLLGVDGEEGGGPAAPAVLTLQTRRKCR